MNPKIINIILKLDNSNRNDTENEGLLKEIVANIKKLTSDINEHSNEFAELKKQ